MKESIGDVGVVAAPGRLCSYLEPVCRCFALLGGGVLILLINMSLISIVGRKIFDAPVPGDIELVEMGAAVAIASFLPLCEIKGMNITADAFTLWAPEPLKRLLDAVAHGLLMFASGVLAWRTAVQVSVYREYGDVSTLLSVPMWIPLLFIVPSLILLSLCAFARMLTVVQNEKGVS